MRWVRRLLVLAVFAGAFWGIWHFARENATVVAISYVFGVIELPVWQALLVCFAAGFVLAALGWFAFGVRARMVQRRYRKAVGGLEAEIHQLRNLPLAPESDLPEPGAAAAPGGGEKGA
jgi:uncharacterized integral membrane protein